MLNKLKYLFSVFILMTVIFVAFQNFTSLQGNQDYFRTSYVIDGEYYFIVSTNNNTRQVLRKYNSNNTFNDIYTLELGNYTYSTVMESRLRHGLNKTKVFNKNNRLYVVYTDTVDSLIYVAIIEKNGDVQSARYSLNPSFKGLCVTTICSHIKGLGKHAYLTDLIIDEDKQNIYFNGGYSWLGKHGNVIYKLPVPDNLKSKPVASTLQTLDRNGKRLSINSSHLYVYTSFFGDFYAINLKTNKMVKHRMNNWDHRLSDPRIVISKPGSQVDFIFGASGTLERRMQHGKTLFLKRDLRPVLQNFFGNHVPIHTQFGTIIIDSASFIDNNRNILMTIDGSPYVYNIHMNKLMNF